jgi:hypothetical protein
MRHNKLSPLFRSGLIILLVAMLIASLPQLRARAASRYYVKGNGGSDFNSGMNWNQAFRNLQQALSVAGNGDEIWVAKAVYYPDNGGPYPLDSRSAVFTLKNGLKVYGGFAGTESSLSQRNITVNPTILSGDVDNNDSNTDGNFIAETTSDIIGANAYHVVNTSGLNAATILDGFIITAGQANAASDPDRSGGGLYNGQGQPTLQNLTFIGNYAETGGGIFNLDGIPSLNSVKLNHNFALYNGGGMWNAGESSLVNGTFDGNVAGNSGGGLMNFGTANNNSDPTLTNIVFSNNQAPSGGGMGNSFGSPSLGTVTFDSNYASTHGGGMANMDNSKPALNSVTFTKNTSGNGGGMFNLGSQPGLTFVDFTANQANFGAGMYNDNSSPSLYGGVYDSNLASGAGGGMENINAAAPTIEKITFKNNQAPTGGGMYNYLSNPSLKSVDFDSNKASSNSSGGGGMYNYASSPTLSKIHFTNNSAINSAGGGMYNYNGSSPQLTDIVFSGNFALNGGGMRNHFNNNQPSLTNVTFSANEAQYGGGMSNDNSTPKLYNVTFSGNFANQGGGMNNYQSSPELWNVTFYGNIAQAADQGGGIYNSASSQPYLRNAILAGSTNGDCINGAGGSIGGLYSLIQDSGGRACGAINGISGFIVGQNPLLGPLLTNGGFTQTHALMRGSPAIDHVMDDWCQPAADQRGYQRWIDGDDNGSAICDIGAVEFGKQVYLPVVHK